MSYVVDLDAFHGPLDLLLYLIEKNQVDIYDIPIALLSDQFIAHLDGREGDLDTIGDFLVMASYLLQLKARMLLPSLVEEDEEQEIDPREELIQRLEEYKRYKEAAEYLISRQDGTIKRVYYRNSGNAEESEVLAADLSMLIRAYQTVLGRMEQEEPVLSIPQEDINVQEKMDEIVQTLARRGSNLRFSELFLTTMRRRELLGLFLALLELVRLQKVEAVQENKFSDIKLYLRVAIDHVDER
ncbi:MAG TPA: segregation/condensation protein A [Syntrophomonadaceae bacterium]|nr:segregation/condensation protein A [Syntrophomonadaceae bacterium]